MIFHISGLFVPFLLRILILTQYCIYFLKNQFSHVILCGLSELSTYFLYYAEYIY